MEELKAELKSIYNMLSTLQVSGDVVDVLAAVRSKLRKSYSMIDHLSKEEGNKDG